jgi:protein tyrosine phosphatase (PTP) superfamily phosphohydrolase (DUF442 family)
MKPLKGLRILWQRLTQQGLIVTGWWAADHAVRIVSGAPIRRVSQISPQLHVGGQYRRRGWPRLQALGITAVINMRVEFDDNDAGIAPPRYLHLPVVDDQAPTVEQLHTGAEFIAEEIANGGTVYIHCGSGIGRAATMAAAYLISTGLSADEAWTSIRQARPFIRPTTAQIEQIERFAAQTLEEEHENET